MTHQQRTIIRAAINNAKRAWLQTQGGYRKVEDDIQGHELRLRRQAADGKPWHQQNPERHAANSRASYHRQLERAREQRRARDREYYLRHRDEILERRRAKRKEAFVDSRSTGHISSTA